MESKLNAVNHKTSSLPAFHNNSEIPCIQSKNSDICMDEQFENTSLYQSDDRSERISAASSISEDAHIEIPSEIPDGPEFADLGKYIDSVTRNMVPVNTHVHIQPDAAIYSSQKADEKSASCFEKRRKHFSDTSLDNDQINQLPVLSKIENGSLTQLSDDHQDNTDDCLKQDFTTESHENNVWITEQPLVEHRSSSTENFAAFQNMDSSDSCLECWAQDEIQTKKDEALVDDYFHHKDQSDVIDKCRSVHEDFEDDDDDDDDFGEFTKSTPVTVSAVIDCAPETTRSASIHHLGILEKMLSRLEPALNKAFPLDALSLCVDSSEPSVFNVEQIQSTCLSDTLADVEDKVAQEPCLSAGSSVWNKIFNQPRVPELRHRWTKSNVYEAYLRSFDMDARMAMPAFANQLGLLEPTRLVAKPPDTQSVIQVCSSTTDESQLKTSSSDAIPVPEFDWSNSGLVNPLQDEISGTCFGQLDFDYLETRSEQTPPKPVSSVDPDLLDLLSEPTTEPASKESLPRPLEELLQTVQQKSEKPPSKPLSASVRAALSRLPGLSYMRSKHLLFPVREQSAD